jgi:type II secretory pathway component PulM
MSPSLGKRQREQQKLEKVRAKAERRAARLAHDAEASPEVPARSETELMEDLEALHRSMESGEISPEEFAERRERIQAQFERLSL